MENNEQIKLMPVNRLSHSSLMQLLRNPLMFKMKHVLGIYDSNMGVSGMVGRAGHEALKAYYGGNPDFVRSTNKADAIYEAIEFGRDYLNSYPDSGIDYKKTGSREKMLAEYNKAMECYFSEEPEYHEIISCEKKMASEITTIYGDILPLPATGIADLVHKERDGTIVIDDKKFVTSFTDYEKEDYVKIIQGMFLYHLLLATEGIKADRMTFTEIKRTKNTDGSPQLRQWGFSFDHEPYFIIFYNLYKDAVKFLSMPEVVYLPNINDQFDGEQIGMIYAQGLINADMSDVEVLHKIKDVEFVQKKFIPSKLDEGLNKNLLPEEKIKIRLAEFGIPVEPVDTIIGTSVIQYRFKVSAGIPMTRFKKHKDDIAIALEAKGDITILAPIPGTAFVGIEVANDSRSSITLDQSHFVPGTLTLPIGDTVDGKPVALPLNEMPHLLVAGTTGSGKSFLLNTFITALTKQLSSDELKLILIDPKRVELKKYKDLPHLQGKILYEYEDALRALINLVSEMERRYEILENANKVNIDEYNKGRRNPENRLPYIVVVLDEMADFMMRADAEKKRRGGKGYSGMSKNSLFKELQKRTGKSSMRISIVDDYGNIDQVSLPFFKGATRDELIDLLERNDATDPINDPGADIELLIVRLAQMARAVGIHLIIATQRPSVDVITGLIKANFPTRIALTTSSATDSVVILGEPGAEKLSGKGDMLFMHPSNKGKIRLQGYKL